MTGIYYCSIYFNNKIKVNIHSAGIHYHKPNSYKGKTSRLLQVVLNKLHDCHHVDVEFEYELQSHQFHNMYILWKITI